LNFEEYEDPKEGWQIRRYGVDIKNKVSSHRYGEQLYADDAIQHRRGYSWKIQKVFNRRDTDRAPYRRTDTLLLGPFLWLGGAAGEKIPSLGDRIAKHTKPNAMLEKATPVSDDGDETLDLLTKTTGAHGAAAARPNTSAAY
jgi:hypothetical protein